MASRAEDFYREIEQLTEPERTAHVEAWLPKGQTENEYLDFKTGKGDDQRKSWSQALSAFANTEGGVLVWGVDAKKPQKPDSMGRRLDQVIGMTPVDDPASLVQLLKDHLRDATIEPVRGVEYLTVPASPSYGPGRGYVICLVPEGANKPYRSLLEQKENYWQRIGDQMLVIPHTLLRSLFYPKTRTSFQVVVTSTGTRMMSFDLLNDGTSSAENVSYTAVYQPKGETFNFETGWKAIQSRTDHTGFVHHLAERATPLHPRQTMPMFNINWSSFKTGVNEPMKVTVTVYASDSLPITFLVVLPEPPDAGERLTFHPGEPSEVDAE